MTHFRLRQGAWRLACCWLAIGLGGLAIAPFAQSLAAQSLAAQSLAAQSLAAQSLGDRLQPLIRSHRGKVAVAIKHLERGEQFEHRADEPMPTASLVKFPVMVAAYEAARQGDIQLEDRVTFGDGDKTPGSGVLTQHFSPGLELPLRDAIRLMIAFSDNAATNVVLNRIGLASTGELMSQLGLPNTKIHSLVFRRDTSLDPQRSQQFGLGSTTAAETVRLYEMLHRRELVSSDASQAMLEHLRACQDDRKLARRLPPEARLAHKSGAVAAARCDAGIMETPSGPIAICVLTSENEDRRWSEDNAAEKLCAAVARAAYDHFAAASSSRAPADAPTPPLAKGASGFLVEALQRTLNARMSPSPDLGVDGDFGPQTEAAVIRFQKSRQLEATGVVQAGTWKALGTLLTRDAAVADPETINRQSLPQAPQPPPDGPPAVTCRAWAVADAKTGEVLWQANAERPLDIASTTKIMTALVVLRRAQKRPELLDEQIVFSRRADRTSGSSARIRAGERLPVRELLYGLLLPSGNDAAIGLAEHVGAKLPASKDAEGEADPVARFVAEMNRTAAQLELRKTHFENPHGLGCCGRRPSRHPWRW